MSTLKCKMCGGTLQYEEGKTVVECEYCGSINTLPNIGDEKRIQAFNRANTLRSNCSFDMAASVYESIVTEYPEEAEAYWGLILCKYGIEYVDDPNSGKKVPTCHKSSFDELFEDENFNYVMEFSDSVSRGVYRKEAKQIEEIRKSIIEISSKEDPYDVFICYKETDNEGNRTVDSTIAQDVYDALVAKNYKVFFSRISLEDKLGQEYEPYIFAALNSAKVMLVFGTSFDNFNAIWVRNEWSRYLKMMEKDKSKHLIPCYRDVDAYDMPKEFKKLQAQDLGKVGAIQDLVRGVEKLLPRGSGETVIQNSGADTAALIERMNHLLSEKEWRKAEMIAETILASDPENTSAYIGILLAERKVSEIKELPNCNIPLDKSRNYELIVKSCDDSTKQSLSKYNEQIKRRLAKRRRIIIAVISIVIIVTVFIFVLITKVWPNYKYNKAMQLYDAGSYMDALTRFEDLGEYNDSSAMIPKCLYGNAKQLFESGKYEDAYELFLGLNYEDSSEWANNCLYAIQVEGLSDLTVGSTINFGFYELDNDESDGREEIEWIVLAREGNKALIISKYVLCFRWFNDRFKGSSWDSSSLREWLNGVFLNNAFNSVEQNRILNSLIDEDISSPESTDNDAGDKVFLLSVQETENYLSLPRDRKCKDLRNRYQIWWLRDAYDDQHVTTIGENGYIMDIGCVVNTARGVRPAMWIDISQ